MAWRIALGAVEAGSGEPNETVTGSGIRSGSRRFCIGLKMLAVARSMCTGMIGTSRPLTIRSSPRWNGQGHARPGDLAFGEDADELAVIERLARLAEGLEDHPGPAAAGDRDRPHDAEEPAQERPLEVLGVDHEPDRPVDRGDHEQAVGERDVVGRQERGAFAGHVIPAHDPQPVERGGQEISTNLRKASGTSQSAQSVPTASTSEAPRNVPWTENPTAARHQRHGRADEHAAR